MHVDQTSQEPGAILSVGGLLNIIYRRRALVFTTAALALPGSPGSTTRVHPPGNGPLGAPLPMRVSTKRTGSNALKRAAIGPGNVAPTGGGLFPRHGSIGVEPRTLNQFDLRPNLLLKASPVTVVELAVPCTLIDSTRPPQSP